jgi:hypothetical protein
LQTRSGKKEKKERVTVSLSPGVRRALQKLIGNLGSNESDTINLILTIYLTERGYMRCEDLREI